MWAQVFERLADVLGRQVRCGGGPADSSHDAESGGKRGELVEAMMQASKILATDAGRSL
jgi:hypothetical protein